MKIVIEIDTDNDQDIRTIEELIELLRKNESSSK
jgi:hypothetical protein|tara:strand:+ start:431 stop:532 length:102 start_codon:yes stop_codon:yes gene_type:complete